ncbi:hypothetical protein BGZ73_008081 [Actinomortierella ambigua]|nr:hypothetical protein BGZ73_008081 [Actinomortierella ambigua]
MTEDIAFQPLSQVEPRPGEEDDQPINTRPQKRIAKLSDYIENMTDGAIKGLGPILIVLAILLLSLCIVCYFTVYVPYHFQWKEGQGIFANWAYILNTIWSLYIVWGILGNYYLAVVTSPGTVMDGLNAVDDNALFQSVLAEMETFTELPPTCKRCHLPKPERTHHCRVCKTCILKYDHHCPWIHNCVGHFNHRYFLMFLTYLSTACMHFVIMGIKPFLLAAEADFDGNSWPYWMDRALVAFAEVLAVAIGLAVGGMACWHWYLALTAQTTLEQYNNTYIRKVCKNKGEKFSNMYDFGIVGNFMDIFNIGPRGHYPWYTALLPIRIPPIGNGKRFERSGRGYVLDFGDDDDDMV